MLDRIFDIPSLIPVELHIGNILNLGHIVYVILPFLLGVFLILLRQNTVDPYFPGLPKEERTFITDFVRPGDAKSVINGREKYRTEVN
jgi:hypothetical protein